VKEKDQSEKITINKYYIFAILIIGFLIWGRSIFNGFVWDDFAQIVNNPLVHSVKNIPRLFVGSTFFTQTNQAGGLEGWYYKPLMSTAFTLVYFLFGKDAGFFHFFQILFHIFNAVLVYLFLKKFFNIHIAFFASLIFLLHPVQVESVAYIAGYQEVLFFFFGMLALLVLTSQKKLSLQHIGAVSVLLLLSVLSKETGGLFFIVVGLYIYLFSETKKNVPLILGVGVGAAIYTILRIHAHIKPGIIPEVPIMAATPAQRLMTIPSMIFYYLKVLFFPVQLGIAQMWATTTFSLSDFWMPLFIDGIFFAILGGIVFWIYKKKPKYLKIFLLFLGIFLLGIGFHLQWIPLDFTVSDRWMYFPLLGLVGMGAVLASQVSRFEVKKYLILLSCFVLVFFAVRTFVRISDWKDTATLFVHDLNISRNNGYSASVIAAELSKIGKYQESIYFTELALKQRPSDITLWYNLALYYEEIRDFANARKAYEHYIQHRPTDFAIVRLARVLIFQLYDYKAARTLLDKATIQYPTVTQLWVMKAIAEDVLGDNDKAIQSIDVATKLSSDPQIAPLSSAIHSDSLSQILPLPPASSAGESTSSDPSSPSPAQ
jgi:tetratricopeptide (TPR) repeat protein